MPPDGPDGGAHPVTVVVTVLLDPPGPSPPCVTNEAWFVMVGHWPRGAVAVMVTTASSGPLAPPSLAARVPTEQETLLPVLTEQLPVPPAEPGSTSKEPATPVRESSRLSVTITPVAGALPVFLTVMV